MYVERHVCMYESMCMYMCCRTNGLGYHEACGDELGGGVFVILWCLSFNGSGFIGSGSYCPYMMGV